MPDNQDSLKVTSPIMAAHITSDESDHERTLYTSSSIDPIVQSSSSLSSGMEIKLSGKRWLVMAAFSVFGLSISLSEVTSPILELYLKLLGLSIQNYLYIQPLFYYFMMALAFPTAICVDKFGIKPAMRVSAGLFVIHGLLRAAIFYPDLPHHDSIKLPFYIISNIVGVEIMTTFFLLPLKISETWFSSSERTVAWSFMSIQFSIGYCFASFLYPKIVRKVEDFKILAYVNIVCTLITALASTLVTQSEPNHPPSERVAKANEQIPISFRKSIIKMLKHQDILAHLIHLAIFESILLCVNNVLQPILKSIGHNEIFTGNLLSFNSLITIIVQMFLAFFVHKVTDHTFVCKLGSFIQGTIAVLHMMVIISSQASWVLISVTTFYTIWRAWMSPNLTNMTAHLASGTVSQATVIGFSMMMTVMAMTVINTIFSKLILIIGPDKQDYVHSLAFLCIVSLFNELFYLVFFYGRQAIKCEETTNQQCDNESNNGTTTIEAVSSYATVHNDPPLRAAHCPQPVNDDHNTNE